jgi:multicomponent Na+:H+ antiporter subunit E
VILALLGLAGVWWVLAEGDLSTWPAALLAVPAAALAFRNLASPLPPLPRPGPLLLFLPWFFWQSVRGGADVALRAFAPRVRIAPGLRNYAIRLRDPAARVVFANAVSLLPGTFNAQLDGATITLHLLDEAMPDSDLVTLEARIGRIFGERLDDG